MLIIPVNICKRIQLSSIISPPFSTGVPPPCKIDISTPRRFPCCLTFLGNLSLSAPLVHLSIALSPSASLDSSGPHCHDSSGPHCLDSSGPHCLESSGPHCLSISGHHCLDSSGTHCLDRSGHHCLDSSGPQLSWQQWSPLSIPQCEQRSESDGAILLFWCYAGAWVKVGKQ